MKRSTRKILTTHVGSIPLIAQGKDREAFADFYKYAAEKGTLFYTPGEQIKRVRPIWVCTAPVTYTGGAALEREIAELKRHVPVEDAFLTSTAPASLEVYRRNEYYKSEEEFVYAIAEAMRVEYEAIVKSGVVLQIDDAWLVALWDRIGIQMGMAAFRRRNAAMPIWMPMRSHSATSHASSIWSTTPDLTMASYSTRIASAMA